MQLPGSPSSHYADLTTSELLELAGGIESLRSEAADLLREELGRRGLTDEDVRDHSSGGAQLQDRILSDSPLQFLQALFFVGHLTISTLAVGSASAALFYTFKPVIAPFVSHGGLSHDGPLMLPLFPIQSIVALLTGFVISRRKGPFWSDKSAQWVWIVPLLWLLLNFVSYQASSALIESRWRHL